ncbi:hypothetical protein L1987_04457 [Smallanthus sonchifolius]|uniref:Uncharacterized protein n=2 Tax=Smallanthus sonchifolius TaxID=185202 RepID=A0ACB9KDK7_9ASTR|nr:hypothetical protein L1987_04456 [Smallanthus sonchifolius]KAI3830319.1 hypothetical protein L1987_04457 [Smallanthus sonchifolius]
MDVSCDRRERMPVTGLWVDHYGLCMMGEACTHISTMGFRGGRDDDLESEKENDLETEQDSDGEDIRSSKGKHLCPRRHEGESIGNIPRDDDHPMQETQGGDKVVTDLQRDRVDEDETMMGENEVLTDDISRVEVNYNEVLLNKEYTGSGFSFDPMHMDSIPIDEKMADGIEIAAKKLAPAGDLNEEGEPEVTSDQSEKTKKFTSTDPGKEGNINPLHIENSIFEMQVGGLREWEKLCLTPVRIIWPDPWSLATPDDLDNNRWEEIKASAKRSRETELREGMGVLSSLKISKSMGKDSTFQSNFFKDHNAMVECLAKWLDSHSKNDIEQRRESAETNHKRSDWADIDREACQEEESNHRKKNKKRKIKGYNPFKSVSQQKEKHGQGAGQDQDMGDNRKIIRVRSSKTKKIDNSWVCDKVDFSQELPETRNISPLGFTDFKVGKYTGKAAYELQPKVTSKLARMDSLKKAIAIKEARLEEIALNINATDANCALRNSILKMKGSKLAKHQQHKSGMTEDGFTLVKRKKGYMGSNESGPSVSQRTFNRPPANNNTRERHPQSASMYERNIVKPKVQGVHNDIVGQHRDNVHQDGNGRVSNIGKNTSIEEKVDGDKNTARGDHTNTRTKQRVNIVETSNSFQLLDEEGNMINEDSMGDNNNLSKVNQYNEGNGNWQRKQERVLNTRFRNSLIQDQRFEAKRYVIDKLVPLDSSLSEWSPNLLEYFRQLCSIYEFGDGYLAAARDRTQDMDCEENANEDLM